MLKITEKYFTALEISNHKSVRYCIDLLAYDYGMITTKRTNVESLWFEFDAFYNKCQDGAQSGVYWCSPFIIFN